MMTTIAMGAGMLPLVFGWGDADPTLPSSDGRCGIGWSGDFDVIKPCGDSSGLYFDG